MKSILLLCYDRPEKLEKCLNSLKKLYRINEYQLIISRQIGSSKKCQKVDQLIRSINWIKTHIRDYIPNEQDSIKTKITANKYTGFSYAFEHLNSNFCVFVEDDSVLGYDFLHFCNSMILKYKNDSFFKAVCGFSIEPKSNNNLFLYSKFRYGIGQAYAITKRQWQRTFKPNWPKQDILLDVHIETEIKKGYVILPAASRLLDIGFGEDASFAANLSQEHINKNKESFVGTSFFEIKNYAYDKYLNFSWRRDCVLYRWYSPITYLFLRILRKTLSLFNIKIKI